MTPADQPPPNASAAAESALAGSLFIVSAPSGAGKTSLVKALVASDEQVVVAISHTTRPLRPRERHGVDYYFVDSATFEQQVEAQAFLEYACVYDHYYGTHRQEVLAQLARGLDVILEIDWQGARQVRAQWPTCQSLFILPPSLSALRQRLVARNQDSPEVIERRMQAAVVDMAHCGEYDFLIINDSFDDSLAALKAIFLAQRQRYPCQRQRYRHLIDTLLSPPV